MVSRRNGISSTDKPDSGSAFDGVLKTGSGGASAGGATTEGGYVGQAGDGNGEAVSRFVKRIESEIYHLLARPKQPGLYLVATPIGNLGDISLRALATLAAADVVYAEDTRHSGRLLSHFGIRTRLRPYHEHNGERERPIILSALERGEMVALISDAGTPLVSDPGYKLVRSCVEAGHLVTSLPGASAPMAALVPSGLPSDTFLFAGFLSTRQQARQGRIKELASVPATLIFFEAPSRVAETLADLAKVLGDRPAVVARELTKLNEEFARGTLATLSHDFGERESIKGEIVIVVGGPLNEEVSETDLEERLKEALSELSVRDAAKMVAEEFGVARRLVYELGLKLQREARSAGGSEGE